MKDPKEVRDEQKGEERPPLLAPVYRPIGRHLTNLKNWYWGNIKAGMWYAIPGVLLFLIIWHAAHRMRITAHDFGIRNDTVVMFICYGIAAAGTVLLLIALFTI